MTGLGLCKAVQRQYSGPPLEDYSDESPPHFERPLVETTSLERLLYWYKRDGLKRGVPLYTSEILHRVVSVYELHPVRCAKSILNLLR